VVGYVVDKCAAMTMELPVNIVRRVVFSPFLPNALVESAKVALRKLNGWENLEVRHSKLINNQTWQNAVTAFPRRHGTIYGPWMDSGDGLQFKEEEPRSSDPT
jgi:hypothetical protein